MHEQVSLIHVAFDECLILLGVAATNDQVVFTGDEPDEFLEPEHLALDASDHLIKVAQVVVIYLETCLVVFIDSVKHQSDLVLLKIDAVD